MYLLSPQPACLKYNSEEEAKEEVHEEDDEDFSSEDAEQEEKKELEKVLPDATLPISMGFQYFYLLDLGRIRVDS